MRLRLKKGGHTNMTRKEMLKVIQDAYNEASSGDELCTEWHAASILNAMERAGMRPPRVSEEDAQAIMHVYCGGNLNQWDEDIARDTKVQEAKARRAAWAIERSTPEGRAAMKKRRQERLAKCNLGTSQAGKLAPLGYPNPFLGEGNEDDTI